MSAADSYISYIYKVGEHALAFAELLQEGPQTSEADYQISLHHIAIGELVPLFDADGNPVMRDGKQMYTPQEHAKEIKVAIATLAEWLDHDRTAVDPLLRGADYLRGDCPKLQPDEVEYVVRQADKIRRGKQP